jgi:GNAT superfamily N-acetyltransferase
MPDMIADMLTAGRWHHAPQHLDAVGEAELLWPTLRHLDSTYPGFRNWFWEKVVPDLGTGARRIFRIGSCEAPSAIGIAKRYPSEAKICTVWVAESERGQGLAKELMYEAIDWLGTAEPLFTVPAERHTEFLSLVKRLKFHETDRVRSLYRAGVVEHIYNGPSKTSSHS